MNLHHNVFPDAHGPLVDCQNVDHLDPESQAAYMELVRGTILDTVGTSKAQEAAFSIKSLEQALDAQTGEPVLQTAPGLTIAS